MFISRKTFRMRSNKTNKVSNAAQNQMESANPITISHTIHQKCDIQLVRYPAVNYLFAVLLIVIFVYLLYSANGGAAGIPGFMQRFWWQYMMAFVPLVGSVLLFIFSQTQSLRIFGEKLNFLKTIMLGFKIYQEIQRNTSDLINIIIVKKGYQMITFTNISYVLVFNFKGYDQLEAMECTSEVTAIDYLSQLNAALPQLRGSKKRITMKDIIQDF